MGRGRLNERKKEGERERGGEGESIILSRNMLYPCHGVSELVVE